MLDYNTALYDNINKKWQFNRVNDLSTTCYIKDSNNHYTYIQPVANHQEEYFLNKLKKMGLSLKGLMYILLPKY